LDRSVDVGRQPEESRSVVFWNFINYAHEISVSSRLRDFNSIGQLISSIQTRVFEYLLHVSSKDSQIEIIIDPSTINGILEYSVNLLPLRSASLGLFMDSRQGQLSSLQISETKFIVLTPALWNILSSFLYQSMEPRKYKQQLLMGLVL